MCAKGQQEEGEEEEEEERWWGTAHVSDAACFLSWLVRWPALDLWGFAEEEKEEEEREKKEERGVWVAVGWGGWSAKRARREHVHMKSIRASHRCL